MSGTRVRLLVAFGVLAADLHAASVALPTAARAPDARPDPASPEERARWSAIHAPLALEWPRDHGAHPDFRTEWWYATGELADADGRAFGYQLTIFRRGIARADDAGAASERRSNLRAYDVYAAHLAIVDLAARDRPDALRSAERLRRAGAGMAGASVRDLDSWVEDWSIRRDEDGAIRLAASDGDLALGLALAPEKPLVLHGDGGVSRKGAADGNASAYVSWTRLATRGSITFAGRAHDVAGESWFDHEWGTSFLESGIAGWDWLALRFADGRELMLYRMRDRDGAPTAASSATLVERDGTARSLSAAEFDCAPAALDPSTPGTAWWRSPRSGARYPTAWRVRVPSASIDATVEARVPACEVDGRASTGVVYWEGPVRVAGSHAGSGYLEMTGYAASLEKRL